MLAFPSPQFACGNVSVLTFLAYQDCVSAVFCIAVCYLTSVTLRDLIQHRRARPPCVPPALRYPFDCLLDDDDALYCINPRICLLDYDYAYYCTSPGFCKSTSTVR